MYDLAFTEVYICNHSPQRRHGCAWQTDAGLGSTRVVLGSCHFAFRLCKQCFSCRNDRCCHLQRVLLFMVVIDLSLVSCRVILLLVGDVGPAYLSI